VSCYFISDPGQPRGQRAADAVLVVVGVVLLLNRVVSFSPSSAPE
jgi:hypothetical protein